MKELGDQREGRALDLNSQFCRWLGDSDRSIAVFDVSIHTIIQYIRAITDQQRKQSPNRLERGIRGCSQRRFQIN